MIKLNGLLIAGAALCLTASAALAQEAQIAPQAALPQADISTTSAVLSATEMWRPITGDLRTGGRLQVRAAGEWRIIPQLNQNTDVAAYRALTRNVGPDGYTDLPLSQEVMLPSAPIGALIGKVGENGAPFLIGSQYDQAIARDGALFVMINDAPNQLADNAGRLSIEMTVTAPPLPQPPIAEEQAVDIVPPRSENVIERPGIPPGLIQAALIGGALLLGLLALGAIFRRPSGARADDARNPAVPQVTTRVANDGVAAQSLTLTMRGRR